MLSQRSVAVVIPTIGRESLSRAVRSALSQDDADVEVIVVVDGPDDPDLATEVRKDGDVHVLFTGGGCGAAVARQLGSERASGYWVAYLDDDDIWLPGKLSQQLAAAHCSVNPERCVVSSQSRSVDVGSGKAQGPIPQNVYNGTEPVSRWLFLRRSLSARRALMPTPTLLLARELALEAGWRRLPRHQDWDFLMRLDALGGVEFIQVDDVLVEFSVGSVESISASPQWQASLEWAKELRPGWDDATFTDFVVGQPLRYAIQARSVDGVRASLRSLPRSEWPSLNAVALGLSGVFDRSVFDRVLHR